MELTLLGFVSLILTAFASPLSHICGELARTCCAEFGALQQCPCLPCWR